jgi:hypothetical protein
LAGARSNPELRGNDVESLADVLADPVQRALAARAGLVLDVDERLRARQLGRQGAAVGAPFARSLRARGRRLGFVRLGLSRVALLDVFECQQQLIFRQALGAATKAVALQFLDDRNKPFCTQASAIRIAFSVSGASGGASAACVLPVTRP